MASASRGCTPRVGVGRRLDDHNEPTGPTLHAGAKLSAYELMWANQLAPGHSVNLRRGRTDCAAERWEVTGAQRLAGEDRDAPSCGDRSRNLSGVRFVLGYHDRE